MFLHFFQETAIEIGKSCKLIQPEMDLVILSSTDVNEVTKKIKKKCHQYVKKIILFYLILFNNIIYFKFILFILHILNIIGYQTEQSFEIIIQIR